MPLGEKKPDLEELVEKSDLGELAEKSDLEELAEKSEELSEKSEELAEKSEELAEKSDLEELAEDPDVINLAKMIKEDPNLSRVTVEVLDSLVRCDAESHFKAVDTTWRNGHFFDLLCKVFDKSHLVYSFAYRMNETRRDLFDLLGECVRKDPMLSSILKSREPNVRMRGALSILIGYWCLDFHLEDYFTGDLGLYGLGIEIISFAGHKTRGTMLPYSTMKGTKERTSPIQQLITVPSISRLTEQILTCYPGIVEVAEKFLKSIVSNFICNCGTGTHLVVHRIHSRQRFAVRAFWRNKDFCKLLLRSMIEDPCLLAIVKKFSDRSTREIALLHTEYIRQCYASKPIFKRSVCLEDKISLALAILFEHWTCMGVLMKVRKQIGFCYTDTETTKKYAEFKEKPISEVRHWPCVDFERPSSASFLMEFVSRWGEENGTETLEEDLESSFLWTGGFVVAEDMTDINDLPKKGFGVSPVLICGHKIEDERENNDLLEKITSVGARARMRMKLESVPGRGLFLTCCF